MNLTVSDRAGSIQKFHQESSTLPNWKYSNFSENRAGGNLPPLPWLSGLVAITHMLYSFANNKNFQITTNEVIVTRRILETILQKQH
jgi:hypothetical protein